jgi:exodeoxyribonuclease VII large subunit
MDFQTRMRSIVLGLLEIKKEELRSLQESYAFKQPAQLIDQHAQRLDELLRQLLNYSKTLLSNKKHLFQNFSGKLHALSPLAILERGYSITLKDGKLLKNIWDVKAGDSITTRLRKGILHSKVTQIENE